MNLIPRIVRSIVNRIPCHDGIPDALSRTQRAIGCQRVLDVSNVIKAIHYIEYHVIVRVKDAMDRQSYVWN